MVTCRNASGCSPKTSRPGKQGPAYRCSGSNAAASLGCNLMNEPVTIHSTDFWVKVVEMLQQNWALIEDEVAGAVRVYFISDTSGVFDEIAFPSASSANEALKLNGFRRFVDSPRSVAAVRSSKMS